MIVVHRLKGEPFVINADLIAMVESAPDTIVRLVDGRSAHVRETPDEVVEAVIAFRAAVLRAADEHRGTPAARTTRNLTVLTGDEA
ncbi:flagellar protein FlbD [Egibacter rhizosphaerae]|uniref:Flagellar protein FlbD n=1 Tax=Egibacter rhizosphaerae TaxID=1670831 RepID=A0A411YJG2_9ACTN|nr:flagellar FlbD family protein [Egibacter rhizosphaerae]QBI21242.1 flagellar protein FlbD [Egibacter rhizosphaerae]